jgi:predicted RND superfamily exporter protein
MNLYHKLLKNIAHFQANNPYLTVALLIMLSIMIYGGVSQVRTVASLEQMMPKDITEIKAFNTLRNNHMGQDIIAVVLEVNRDSELETGITDIADYRTYQYLNLISVQLREELDILEVYSMADVINGAAGKEVTQEEFDQLLTQSHVRQNLANFINDDKSISLLLATTDVSADDPRMNLLSDKVKGIVESAGTPPGISIRFTGTPIIQQRLGELIAADRSNTQWISTLFVFIITMIIFGTFTSAIVPILVVTVSVTWLYGTMGYTDLPISTLAGGVAAMVIGIGIDFAIHIMNKFRYERKKGLSIEDSIEAAVVETGTALTATSVTTITAFLAFLVGLMPEMGRFGILMAIGITYSLVFSLFGLPALLIIEEDLIYWLKKKLRFGIEAELTLKTQKESCKGGKANA